MIDIPLLAKISIWAILSVISLAVICIVYDDYESWSMIQIGVKTPEKEV